MPTFNDFIEPGRKVLAYRLDQLCVTLENLGTRLRGTIAAAISETISGIVRDTALRVLDEASQYLPGNDPSLPPSSRTASDPCARRSFEPKERSYWSDDDDDRYEPDIREEPTTPTPPERLPSALSAGLQAASWWLRRCSGRGRTLTTLAIGVVATGVAFLGGPLVAAILGFAEVAMQCNNLADAIGTGASTFNRFDSA
jgi:hypothetical protein